MKTTSKLYLGPIASILLALFCCVTRVSAQDNYEIQVYGSETIPSGVTMVELHNNFTVQGSKKVVDGLLPTHHAWHETIEITHGFNDWFETGFYIFTSARNGNGWDWVGSHIRPRFFAFQKNGTGQLVSAFPNGNRLSAAGRTRPIPGAGRFVPSSTKKSAAGISHLTQLLNAHSKGLGRNAGSSLRPTLRSVMRLRRRLMEGSNIMAL